MLSNNQRPAALKVSSSERQLGLGWIPTLSVVVGTGLLLVALAFAQARSGLPWSEGLFWSGLILVVAPLTVRLAAADVHRVERQSLAALLVLALYLVKFMHSPYIFLFPDEFSHARNVINILREGALFSEDTLLPVSALFPGLAIVTSAVIESTGLSVFAAGLLIVGIAKLILSLALFSLYERLSGSPRVAGLGVVLFAGNPNFLFWSSQFAYESLAFPLLVAGLNGVHAVETQQPVRQRTSLLTASVVMLLGLVVTHHLTSYFLTLLLVLSILMHHRACEILKNWLMKVIQWYSGQVTTSAVLRGLLSDVAQFLRRLAPDSPLGYVEGRRPGPSVAMATLNVVATTGWLVYIAGLTLDYLLPVLTRASLAMFHMILGEIAGRQLFQSATGELAPLWERMVGLVAVLLCLLGLPLGLRGVWLRHRQQPLAVVLAGAACLYFGFLGLRLMPAAWETGNRASVFMFLGLAFVLSVGGIGAWDSSRWQRSIRAALVVGVSIIFLGGVISGWPPSVRLPKAYLVEVGAVRLEPQGVAASAWMLKSLGPDHRVAADEVNARYLLDRGLQFAFVPRFPGVAAVFSSPDFGLWERQVMGVLGVEFILFDRRQVSWDNMAGYYFDRHSADDDRGVYYFDRARERKLDENVLIARVYDSGDIAIFDTRRLSGVR